jgi:DNA mismatch endonuclease, patch repair protein
VDSVSPEIRSTVMARVRSSGNRSTEWRLRAALIQAGIRGWSMNSTEVCGKPDFVFRAQQVAVFVDGCFWHGCGACKRIPGSNVSYWGEKIARNRKRDRKVTRALRESGWTVLRIWEHQLTDLGSVLKRIDIALGCVRGRTAKSGG